MKGGFGHRRKLERRCLKKKGKPSDNRFGVRNDTVDWERGTIPAPLIQKRGETMNVRYLTVLLLLLWIPAPCAATDPVKVGFCHVFSGNMSSFGLAAKKGIEMAKQEINNAGGINGRPIEIVYADTKVKPDIGEKAVRRLVTDAKVDVVMGIVSSAVAKRVAQIMNELKTPLLITHAMTCCITEKLGNPWVFRITWNVKQSIKSAALIARTTDVKKWTTVAPDYNFGHESWAMFQKKFKELVPAAEFQKPIYAPLSTNDWTPYLDRIESSNAKGILITLWGRNMTDFLHQAHARGLPREGMEFLCPVGGSVDTFWALGPLRMPVGIWFGAPYWYSAYQNLHNDRFVQKYRSLTSVKLPPSYAAYMPYAALKVYAGAAQKIGGTGKRQIAEALEGLSLDLPTGRFAFQGRNHQGMFNVAWGKTCSLTGNRGRTRALMPIRLFEVEEINPIVGASLH
jgi:branched-chain amino acid transport system substrate-binding protein